MSPLEVLSVPLHSPYPPSRRVQFDDANDILVIDGFRVHANVLSEFTRVTPIGRWFRITSREDGVITIETKQD